MNNLERVLSIGKKHTASEWMVILGTTRSSVYSLFKYYNKSIGHLIESRAVCRSEPIRYAMEDSGKAKTVKEWAALLGFKASDVRNAVAKYPPLKSYIIKERNRTVHRLPDVWAKTIENSDEKLTIRGWSERFNCSVDTMRSYVAGRKHLKQYIAYSSDEKFKELIARIESIRDKLPMRVTAICAEVGTSTNTIGYYKEEILDRLGMSVDEFIQKPIKEEIIKAISEAEELYTMTEWANFFGVDLSHVSRIVHNYNLLLRIRPSLSMPIFRQVKKSIDYSKIDA